jgi:hypothetical protein
MEAQNLVVLFYSKLIENNNRWNRSYEDPTMKRSLYLTKLTLTAIILICAGFACQLSPINELTDPLTLSTNLWSFVDGSNGSGTNFNQAEFAYAPQFATLDSKLYALWRETKSSGLLPQVRVALYGGDAAPGWSFIEKSTPNLNGLNVDSTYFANAAHLVADGSKLYAIWAESAEATPVPGTAPGLPFTTTSLIRVKEYNGDDSSPNWTLMETLDNNAIPRTTGGINFNLDTINGSYPSNCYATSPKLAVFNSRLFAIWIEKMANNYTSPDPANFLVRVRYYSAGQWHQAESGTANDNALIGINTNISPSAGASDPQLAVYNSKLYAAWSEIDPAGSIKKIRIKVYNEGSNTWSTFAGGGALNKDALENAARPALFATGSKLYLSWDETGSNGKSQIRVRAYDGSDWSWVDGGGDTGINMSSSEDAYESQMTGTDSVVFVTWDENSPGTSMHQHIRVKAFDGSTTWHWADGGGTTGILDQSSSFTSWAPQAIVYNSKLYVGWQSGPANDAGPQEYARVIFAKGELQ